MLKVIRPATGIALVTIILTLTLLSQPQLTDSGAAAAQGRSQTPQPNQRDRGSKVIQGQSVKDYVQQLRLKDKALNRALKDMEGWGKLPNWESSAIIRETAKPKNEVASLNFMPASFTQDQYWSDGSGNELIVITAYGSEAHWDGTVYTYNASTGETSTYNGVVNDIVSNDPETSDVIDELYYPPDGGAPYREGGGGGCGSNYDHQQLCLDTMTSASNKEIPGKAKITNVSSTTSAKPVGFVGWFKRYFRCIKRCTALATQTCFQRNTNNFRNFFVCLAIGGTAASISCAFNTRSCGG